MNFADILSPFATQEFIQSYWEKDFLHIKREEEEYYDSILSKKDIDSHLFGNDNLAVSPFKLYLGKQEAQLSEWSNSQTHNGVDSRVVDHQKVFGLFQRGFSLYVNYPEKLFPQLKAFVLQVEEELRAQTISHLIISPPHTQGFLPHTDPYGVFVLQLSGDKNWRLFGKSNDPLLPHGQDQHHLSGQKAQQSIELSAGSLLYLPRGLVHSVSTAESYSIHLSLGILPPTGKDILHVLGRESLVNPFFLQYVPYGFLGSATEQELYQEAFKQQLIAYIEQADIFAKLDSAWERNRTPNNSKRLEELGNKSPLGLDSVLQIKPGLSFSFREDPLKGICMLIYEGKHLNFPLSWNAELQRIVKIPHFLVRDLGVSLQIGEEEQIQVARNMIQAGFLEISSPNATAEK